uniref:Uncharacterized protein LOC102809142 n=1 Tax=Saccoglossus kowalevskii TaxID=10224 RepID=A0ABM0MLN9_SACKO
DSKQVTEYQQSRIPKTTRSATKWGVKTWNEWKEQRNVKVEYDKSDEEVYHLVPSLDENLVQKEFDFWLCTFAIESRIQDGQQYPPDSLRQMFCAIYRYLRDDCNRPNLNFMDQGNHDFLGFRNTLDGVMKTLSLWYWYPKKKQAEPFSLNDEEKLWAHAFGTNIALRMSYATYFYMCKIFGLRAADDIQH